MKTSKTPQPMKTNFATFTKRILAGVCLILLAASANATIWRVNGNPGVDADFTSISVAVGNGSVLAGDTIIVEPMISGSAYGGFNPSKRLNIYGSGYLLNQNDSTQALMISTVANSIQFLPGSQFSILSGFSNTSITISTDNITIEKCYFVTQDISIGASGNSATIRKCYFAGSGNIGINSSSALIYNNIFNRTSSSNDLSTNGAGNAIISNNVFNKGVSVNNSFLTSNIFKGTDAPTGTSNTFNNNVFAANPTVTGANNQFNVDMSTVFVGGSHPEEQFILKAGSPAIGAGTGGINCGAYGGTDPYMLSGMPPIPSIFFFSADSLPGIGSNAINVQIKAKVNK